MGEIDEKAKESQPSSEAGVFKTFADATVKIIGLVEQNARVLALIIVIFGAILGVSNYKLINSPNELKDYQWILLFSLDMLFAGLIVFVFIIFYAKFTRHEQKEKQEQPEEKLADTALRDEPASHVDEGDEAGGSTILRGKNFYGIDTSVVSFFKECEGAKKVIFYNTMISIEDWSHDAMELHLSFQNAAANHIHQRTLFSIASEIKNGRPLAFPYPFLTPFMRVFFVPQTWNELGNEIQRQRDIWAHFGEEHGTEVEQLRLLGQMRSLVLKHRNMGCPTAIITADKLCDYYISEMNNGCKYISNQNLENVLGLPVVKNGEYIQHQELLTKIQERIKLMALPWGNGDVGVERTGGATNKRLQGIDFAVITKHDGQQSVWIVAPNRLNELTYLEIYDDGPLGSLVTKPTGPRLELHKEFWPLWKKTAIEFSAFIENEVQAFEEVSFFPAERDMDIGDHHSALSEQYRNVVSIKNMLEMIGNLIPVDEYSKIDNDKKALLKQLSSMYVAREWCSPRIFTANIDGYN